ncbi:MAG: ATP-binding protein [Verrucomicrobiota bacterium]
MINLLKNAPVKVLVTTRLAAITIVTMALTVLIGWHYHIPTIVQIHSSLVPMQYNTALCFLLSGLALLATTFGKTKVTFTLGFFTSVIGAVTLSQYLLDANYGIDELFFKHYIFTNTSHPGRMSPLTALVFTLGGIASIFLSTRNRFKFGSMIPGILGSLIYAIGTMAIFSYATGLMGTYSWGQFTRMALHTGTAAVILGIGLTAIAWFIQTAKTGITPGWLPFAAALATFSSTLIIYNSLITKERLETSRLHSANAEIARNELITRLDSLYLALKRMTGRWTPSTNHLETEWRRDAMQHITDFPAYREIALIDSQKKPLWSLQSPDHPYSSLGELFILENTGAKKSLHPEDWKSNRFSHTVRFSDGSLGLMLPLSIKRDNEPEEFMVGAFQLNQLLDAILHKNIIFNYSISVKESGSVIYQRSSAGKNEARKRQTILPINIHGLDWMIEVQPDDETVTTLNSPYPLVVLILGTLFSGLMAVSIQLGNNSNTHTKLLRKTNQELAELGSLKQGILAHAAYAVISTKPNGIITSFNPAAERMLGYKADEVIHITSPSIFHDPAEIEKRAEQLSLELGRTINPGFEVFIAKSQSSQPEPQEWTYIRKDGSRFPVSLVVTALLNQSKEIVGYLGIANDVSELKRILEELSQARDEALASVRIKGRFLANMSHEIRTPMNGIIGIAEILSLTPLSTDQTDYLNTIRNSADLLMDIINTILDSSKIESGKMDFKHEQFDIRELIDGVFNVITGVAHMKNLAISHVIQPDVYPYLIGDDGRIRQVLTNILGNSLKFTEIGKIILTVSCIKRTENNTTLEFEIKDTGIGISEHDLPHVFDPFRQADDTDTRKYGGTGLGLTICRQIVEALGGKIQAESIYGQGTTFRLHLDFDTFTPSDIPRKSNNNHEPARKDSSIPTQSVRILVVEDNLVNQKIATLQLQKLGYLADVAGDGEKALLAIKENDYDLILMDCQMPVMDGFSATRKIRETQTKPIPIIAMTSNAMMSDREKCLSAGMDDYLSKPVTLNELKQMIEHHLTKSPARDSETKKPIPVNLEHLSEITDGDLGVINQISQDYLKQAQKILEAIHDAITEKSFHKIRHLAHKLCGSSSACGMTAIIEPLRKIERLSDESDFDTAASLLNEAKVQLGIMDTYIKNKIS